VILEAAVMLPPGFALITRITIAKQKVSNAYIIKNYKILHRKGRIPSFSVQFLLTLQPKLLIR
jgi:hypothetical protein